MKVQPYYSLDNSAFIRYLRCYIIWSELGCHQVTLVYLGKSKVTQFNRSILKQAGKILLRKRAVFKAQIFPFHVNSSYLGCCLLLFWDYSLTTATSQKLARFSNKSPRHTSSPGMGGSKWQFHCTCKVGRDKTGHELHRCNKQNICIRRMCGGVWPGGMRDLCNIISRTGRVQTHVRSFTQGPLAGLLA